MLFPLPRISLSPFLDGRLLDTHNKMIIMEVIYIRYLTWVKPIIAYNPPNSCVVLVLFFILTLQAEA